MLQGVLLALALGLRGPVNSCSVAELRLVSVLGVADPKVIVRMLDASGANLPATCPTPVVNVTRKWRDAEGYHYEDIPVREESRLVYSFTAEGGEYEMLVVARWSSKQARAWFSWD